MWVGACNVLCVTSSRRYLSLCIRKLDGGVCERLSDYAIFSIV